MPSPSDMEDREREERMSELRYKIQDLEELASDADRFDDYGAEELRAQAGELQEELDELERGLDRYKPGDYRVEEAHKPRGKRTGLADGSTMDGIRTAFVKGDGMATFIQDTLDWDYLDALVEQGLVHDDYSFNGREVRASLTARGEDEFGTKTSAFMNRKPPMEEGYACNVCGQEHQPYWSDDDDAELEPQDNCYVKPMPLAWVYKGFKDVV